VLVWTDPSGRGWRVSDLAFGPPLCPDGRWGRLPVGDPGASHRMFLREVGDQAERHWPMITRLAPAEGATLDDAALAAQLERAAAWEAESAAER